MEEKKISVRKRHQLTLRNRENLSVDGVLNVDSFDESEISLETDEGMMVVRGEDLHIKELNLESGNLVVDGFIHTLEYTGDTPGKKAKGFLGKLFR